MKKKLVIILIIFLIVIFIVVMLKCFYKKNIDYSEVENKNNDSSEENNNELSIIKEITIYDIEEGYLNVNFNNLANKNNYNFDKIVKDNNGYYKYEDEKYISKIGIDVSSYQGDIDWKKVKESGIDFAIIRIGYRGYGNEGNIVLDPKFESNYKKAKKEGIDVGIYFFSQAINIEEIK